MKGLLAKDLQFIITQKAFFIFIGILGGILSVVAGSAGFIVGYVVFIFGFFTLNTITYDEMEDGYAFLFTLPVSRKDYVLEKYLFGIIVSVGAAVASTAVALIFHLFLELGEPLDILITGAVSLGMVIVFLALNLPIHLRFQGDKARMVLILIMGAFIGIIVFLANSGILTANTFASAFALVSGWGIALRVAAIVVAIMVTLAISALISIRVMNKKEF